MKNTIKILLAVVAISLSGSLYAQKTIKLGYINSNDLLQIMPGKDSAQNALQKAAKEMEATLKSMQSELEQRYNEFLEKQNSMSDLIKQTKQRELQDMSVRIEEFQQNAQKKLQEEERRLLTPIIDKAKEAITEVAKENKYTYVFDSGVGTLLYQEDSDDIMPLVKKKLGLK